MDRHGVRSLVLLSALIVFSFLLAGGGPRLIGHADEYGVDAAASALPLSAAISQAPQRAEETGAVQKPVSQLLRRAAAAVQPQMCMDQRVVSDANGNILRCTSYMRAVYQSFSLGDGFV